MTPRRLLLALAAALLLGGCAATPWTSGEAREVIELLDFHDRMVGMATDEQRREYQAALAAFEKQPGDTQRLRLALLLTQPRAPWRDDARALQLLAGMEPIPAGQPSPRRDLAVLIQKLVAERQRQIRDEHRKVEDLQQKLDSLRAIDRETRQKPPRR
ncbi:hypothetical protein [Sulfurisoma sediminicola]|uniref:Lipoprotein n=1 Tax=Sulfurisoma sediminicola TaxID=1381557 RepID=A0A497XB38_9PROT|nr:hypothetical protein [Sulfurisoma sediminicola]RLJ63530.1 hypothetical protein DFR35_2154 [Sulfurisoma sediminicola]